MTSKVPVVNRSEYTILLENVDNQAVFAHCNVYKWNKTVKKNLKKDFDIVLSLQSGPILALHDKHDKKHKKFLQMFGFNYLQDIKLVDGANKELYMVTGDTNG